MELVNVEIKEENNMFDILPIEYDGPIIIESELDDFNFESFLMLGATNNDKPKGNNVKPKGNHDKPIGNNDKLKGNHDQPKGNHDKRKRKHDKPKGNYDKPNGNHDKPKENHDIPKGNHNKPKINHDKPKGNHDKPKRNHDKPNGNHDKPKGNHDKPKGNHDKPKGNHDITNGNHDKPKENHNKSKGNRICMRCSEPIAESVNKSKNVSIRNTLFCCDCRVSVKKIKRNRLAKIRCMKDWEGFLRVTKPGEQDPNLFGDDSTLFTGRIKNMCNGCIAAKYTRKYFEIDPFPNESACKNEEYDCPVCHTRMEGWSEIKTHVRAHLFDPHMNCKDCNRMFTNPQHKWSSAATLKFIRAYSTKPCLWDPNHKDHKNKKLRENVLQDIVNEMGLRGFDVPQARAKIVTIRNMYTIQINKIRKSPAHKPYIPKRIWFRLADSFLRISKSSGLEKWTEEELEKLNRTSRKRPAPIEDEEENGGPKKKKRKRPRPKRAIRIEVSESEYSSADDEEDPITEYLDAESFANFIVKELSQIPEEEHVDVKKEILDIFALRESYLNDLSSDDDYCC